VSCRGIGVTSPFEPLDRVYPMRPKLLDLFCGSGGASMGYYLAGFDVTGVDIEPQPHFPFAFVQADAMTFPLNGFDVIHCSPPCQAYSNLKGLTTREYPQLISAIGRRLRLSGIPYVIENVRGAASVLQSVLMLCGSMFGLQTPCGAQLRRHRLFESNVLLMSPGSCRHKGRSISITGRTPQRQVVYNTTRETFSVDAARQAMGIPWMTMRELSQAIPPAYTQFIGLSLLGACDD
jgi:DNA (cytosine-5)-methyltransferase 1